MKIFYWKYLLALLLVNSILSIPLKLNERENNGVVNLRVKRAVNGGGRNFFFFIDFQSIVRKSVKMFALIP